MHPLRPLRFSGTLARSLHLQRNFLLQEGISALRVRQDAAGNQEDAQREYQTHP
jgi:hypothetical protein